MGAPRVSSPIRRSLLRPNPNLASEAMVAAERIDAGRPAVESGAVSTGRNEQSAFEAFRRNLEAMHQKAQDGGSPAHTDDPSTGYVPMYEAGKVTIPGAHSPSPGTLIGRTNVSEWGTNNYGDSHWSQIEENFRDRNKGVEQGGGLSPVIHPQGLDQNFRRPITVIQSPGNDFDMEGDLGRFIPGADLAMWNARENGGFVPAHEMTHAALDPVLDGQAIGDRWPLDLNLPMQAIMDKSRRWARRHGGFDEFRGPDGRQILLRNSLFDELETDIGRYADVAEARNDLARILWDSQAWFGVRPKTPDETGELMERIFRHPVSFNATDPIIRSGPRAGQPAHGYRRTQRGLYFFLRPLLDDPATKPRAYKMGHDFGQTQGDQPWVSHTV